MRRIWVVMLCSIGCTTFDPVARDVCGNGLVEAGEDCDSSEATCVACAVVCTAATDCPTTAYTCGADDRCHAPGGTLGESQVAGAFAANDFRITDVDHDGIGDVVGVSSSSIVIRHGAASGVLAVTESSLTPAQTGPAAFGHIDGDSSLDLALSTPDGIVPYTSPYGTLSPLNVTDVFSDVTGMAGLDIRYLFSITHTAVGVLTTDNIPGDATFGHLIYLIFDFAVSADPTAAAPCGLAIAPADLATADIEVYPVSGGTDQSADVVVAIRVGSTMDKKLCVLAVHKQGDLVASTVTNITPTNAPAYKTKPVLADLTIDNDPCPSLIDVDGGLGALRRYDGLMVASGTAAQHCTIKPFATPGGDTLPALDAPAQSTIIGRAPTVPAVPACAPDTIVTTDGLYVLLSNAWYNVYQSTRPWAHVAYSDFNHDNSTDLVLAGRDADDLDILLRESYAFYPVYELFRLDTAAKVTSLMIDDYDGNGYADIAFTQQIASHTELDISYVTADRPQPPVAVGAFSSLIAAAKFGIPDSADPLSLVADLMVLIPGQPYAGLTFLHGSVQRTMLPFFDPRSSPFSTGTFFRSAVIGNFVPSTAGTVDYPDIIALASPKAASAVSLPNNDARGWVAIGNGGALDSSTSDGATIGNLSSCDVTTATTACVEDSSLLAWPVSPSHDVIFTLDRSTTATATVIDPSIALSITATPATGFGPIPPSSISHSLHAADLDGDGVPELVAAFAPVDGTSGLGGVLVCGVGSDGQPHDCVDVAATAIAAIAPAPVCFDAAAGHFGYSDRFSTPRTGEDLVVACRDGTGTALYRVSSVAGAYTAELVLHTANVLGSIQTGDVTGDGVDDVVALQGDSGNQVLVVFAQCTSRDATSCTGVGR